MNRPWRQFVLLALVVLVSFGGTFTCRYNDDDDDDVFDDGDITNPPPASAR